MIVLILVLVWVLSRFDQWTERRGSGRGHTAAVRRAQEVEEEREAVAGARKPAGQGRRVRRGRARLSCWRGAAARRRDALGGGAHARRRLGGVLPLGRGTGERSATARDADVTSHARSAGAVTKEAE